MVLRFAFKVLMFEDDLRMGIKECYWDGIHVDKWVDRKSTLFMVKMVAQRVRQIRKMIDF